MRLSLRKIFSKRKTLLLRTENRFCLLLFFEGALQNLRSSRFNYFEHGPVEKFRKLTIFSCIVLALVKSSLLATTAYYDAMGLKDRYWMSKSALPYMFVNPAFAVDQAGRAYFEFDAQNLYGGILSAGRNGTLGIFSGRPVQAEVFNSASAPRGMFSVGSTDYFPLTNVANGSNLDIAATSPLSSGAQFGNLDARVNLLSDPGVNALKTSNVSLLAATRLGNGALGVLLEYGWANDIYSFRGQTSEDLQLDKRQAKVNVGFSGNSGGTMEIFDFQTSLALFSLDNRYLGTASSGESALGEYKSDGSFEFDTGIRIAFRVSPRSVIFVRTSFRLSDFSTVLASKISGGDFDSTINIPTNTRDTFSRTGQTYSFGIADEIQAGQVTRFIFGIEGVYETYLHSYDGRDFRLNTYQISPYEAEYNIVRLPMILGMEAAFTKSFSLRLGIVQQTVALPDNGYFITRNFRTRINPGFSASNPSVSTSETQLAGADTEINVGFSYQLSSFRFDWLSNLELFRSGPNFISGRTRELSIALAVTSQFMDLWSSLQSQE
ncbi:MAG: hypothetical protein KDK38_06430 [Leptospiraceae bacterium]|nr:hypothetical protein [Leptospiraceae bacterium]